MTTYQATWPGGQTVVWRNLTWAEFNQLKSDLETNTLTIPVALYLKVYGICRIEGPAPEVALAGIVRWIGQQQTAENPFNGEYKDISTSLELARTAVRGNYLLSAKSFVASAFHISFQEIDQMDADTFFVRLAQAELILGRSCTPSNPEAVPAEPVRKLNARELARKRHEDQRKKETPTVEVESTNAIRSARTTSVTKR